MAISPVLCNQGRMLTVSLSSSSPSFSSAIVARSSIASSPGKATPLSSSVSHSTGLLLTSTRRRRSSPRRFFAALDDSSSSAGRREVFKGLYGPWSIDSNDVREVFLYRAGLVTTAVAFVAAGTRAFLPQDSPFLSTLEEYSDVLYGVGAAGLGISLLLIHIYVTPIKRTLQTLWAIGVFGSAILAVNTAAPIDKSLVDYVLENRWAIWLVGPLFAALTGLVFKEGLCYGKLEAGLLALVIPSLLLGHLSGAMDEKVELGLLLAWMILFSVFAARKFTQPIKDDIGDKSIFMFNALPEKEKEARLVELERSTAVDKQQ